MFTGKLGPITGGLISKVEEGLKVVVYGNLFPPPPQPIVYGTVAMWLVGRNVPAEHLRKKSRCSWAKVQDVIQTSPLI